MSGNDPTAPGYNLAFALGTLVRDWGMTQCVSSAVIVFTPSGDWMVVSPDIKSEQGIVSFLNDAVKGIEKGIELREMPAASPTKN